MQQNNKIAEWEGSWQGILLQVTVVASNNLQCNVKAENDKSHLMFSVRTTVYIGFIQIMPNI